MGLAMGLRLATDAGKQTQRWSQQRHQGTLTWEDLTRHSKGEEGSEQRDAAVGPPAHPPSARALTVHVAAQHGFVQRVHTALLQPLLGWGRVQAQEVLRLTGATCTSVPRGSGPASPPPACPFGGLRFCIFYLGPSTLLPSGAGEWGPYLEKGGAGGAFQGPTVAVQQLSSILDGFGDSVPFTKEAYRTGRRRRRRS